MTGYRRSDSNEKYALWASVIITLAIRLALAPFTEHRWDMYVWRFHQVAYDVYGANPFWLPEGWPELLYWSYPPLWLIILILIHRAVSFVWPVSYPTDPGSLWSSGRGNIFEAYHSFLPDNLMLLDFFIKLPSIAADLATALLVYLMASSLSEKSYALKTVRAWLVNPYAIFISSVWGMFDPLATVFAVLCIFLLLRNPARIKASALALGLSAGFKLYALILTPVILAFIYKCGRSLKQAAIFLGVAMSAFSLSLLPYFLISHDQDPLSLIWLLMSNRAAPSFYGSPVYFGLTPLVLAGKLMPSLPTATFTSLMAIGIILIAYGVLRLARPTHEDLLRAITASHFLLYLTYPIVNPQHIVWILPFLLTLATCLRSSLLSSIYWYISIGTLASELAFFQMPDYFLSPLLLPYTILPQSLMYEYYEVFLPTLGPPEVILGIMALSIYALGLMRSTKGADAFLLSILKRKFEIERFRPC